MTVKFDDLNPLHFWGTKGIVTPKYAPGLSRNGPSWPHWCHQYARFAPLGVMRPREGLETSSLATGERTTEKTQGPVVQKAINANPRLKINQGVYFSSPKCFSTLIIGKTLH